MHLTIPSAGAWKAINFIAAVPGRQSSVTPIFSRIRTMPEAPRVVKLDWRLCWVT
jgi:hypothetical protein